MFQSFFFTLNDRHSKFAKQNFSCATVLLTGTELNLNLEKYVSDVKIKAFKGLMQYNDYKNPQPLEPIAIHKCT